MTEVPGLIEQARRDGDRAEHDRVQADGGDQKENGAPPMERRNTQGGFILQGQPASHFTHALSGSTTGLNFLCHLDFFFVSFVASWQEM